MSRLRDLSWWPTTWLDEKGLPISPAPSDGILKNIRRVNNDLLLIVDHNGGIYTATISSHLSEDFLILLRHILLQHWGNPLSAVEDLEIDFSRIQSGSGVIECCSTK